MSDAKKLLDYLNRTYTELHRKYEELFWLVKMGDKALTNQMNAAQKEHDLFQSSPDNLKKIKTLLKNPELSPLEKEKLKIWENFFKLYQTPPELANLKSKIAELESEIDKKMSTRTEGYLDPQSNQFVPASIMKMRMIIRTDANESLRKACWTALEAISTTLLDDYVQIVALRNEYAKKLGFEDFYAYRVHISEGMTKKQIFDIFNEIYEDTKGTFQKIREMEKTQPGLRKPWNFGYLMSGSFTKEEEPYYDFDEALIRWGKSFAALGIDYKGGTLQLDLLDRENKHHNGFCHYPMIVNFNDGNRNPGAADFTCNVVYRQVGAGALGMLTLFHEGGHAADRLNSEQTEVCLNSEYPPASIAWAETHSQFLDTMLSSIDWRTRYAKNGKGEMYPLELFEKKVRKLRILGPLGLHSIMMVSEFEKIIYETKNLTAEKTIAIAKEIYRKYHDFDEESISILDTSHIYSWESSGYYHAYGLAILALEQWRKYFYEKYGYIVDNPAIGKEMTEVWKLGSAKTFAEFVKIATGQPLSPKAFLENALMSADDYIELAQKRIQKTKSAPQFQKPINLNAKIKIVHGKEIIADNSKSFEDMAEKYKAWLHAQTKT